MSTSTMQQRTSKVLFSYWNEVRGERIAPRRFDIEPAQLGDVLSETFILECDDDMQPTFRLAGTRICENFGREFRGCRLTDLFQVDDLGVLQHNFAALRDQGAVVVLDAQAKVDDRRSVRFEIVLMPLLHTGSNINRILGTITAVDSPVWLGSERLPPLSLLGHLLVWPEGRPHAVAEQFRAQNALIPELAGARVVRVNRRSFRILDGGIE